MSRRKFSKSKINSMYFIAIFFKLFGLAPFRVTFLPKRYFGKPRANFSHSWKGVIYNFVLSISLAVILVDVIVKFSELWKIDSLATWVFISILWITISIFLYFCFRQQKSIQVLSELVELEYNLIDNFNRSVSRKHKNLNYEISLFVPQILLAVLHIIFFIIRVPKIELFIVLISEVVINNLVLLYALIINFIIKRFDFLNEVLLSFSPSISKTQRSDISFLTSSTRNEMTLKTLILVREQQRKLYQISKDVSKFFSWPMMLATALFCLRLIFYSYDFVKQLIFCPADITLLSIATGPVTLVKEIFLIMVLMYHMTRFTFEMQKTGEIIHKIMDLYSMHGGIQSQLEQFSIEVLHRRIPNSVLRLFTIDGALVTSIARSTITYLVIVIQLADKETACDSLQIPIDVN